ncbi:uncharacterized protein LOC130814654 [Amaranthus tricolor]|uniref:uncharacterized protein LOC130814654 n=1 Tax=Amaranthus tricolor TaxID=29722 RepID=UPI0025856AB7|nr:uncharacterized protein LOC130814654 [Amaranthus tricolor]
MKLNSVVAGEKNGIEEINGLKYENSGNNKSDCYIVDLENICNGGVNLLQHSSTTTNSRITLQRSVSRKVPQRGVEKKVIDRDTTSLALSSSPRDAQVVSTPMKPISPPTMPLGSQNHIMTTHQHNHSVQQHQITIKTGGISTIADGRLGSRSSLKRSSYTWFSDPKRILLFFASLSSMGTMLLIYFTLAVSKANDKDNVLDWQ